MNSNDNPKDFFSLAGLSFGGEITAAKGFKSAMVAVSSFGTINIACMSKSQTITLNIFSNNVASNAATKTLFFTITLAADTPFYKRFIIPNNYVQVEVVATGDTFIFLNTSLNSSQQTSAYTFLNSSIDKNDDTALIRVANSFQEDLVRNLHTDFEKVNINGFMNTLPAPSASETIGLDANYVLTSGASQQTIVSTNDDPSGTGARSIRYIGVADDGTAFNSNLTTGSGVGTIGLNARVINRAIVSSAGSGLKNDGLITAQTQGSLNPLIRVEAGENISHCALYAVAADKQLVLKDINICATAPQGEINVIEINSAGMEFSLGRFEVNTAYQQLSYTLDGLVDANSVVKVNFKNTSSVAAGQPCSINVNINGMLCPLINTY